MTPADFPDLPAGGPDSVRIELQPLGRVLTVERGAALQDVLFAQGVEFPCGGRGRCQGCRVKVLAGTLPVTAEMQRMFTASELAQGWRLACQCQADGDLNLELAQWEASILSDDSAFAFTPQEGMGIAVDLGSTTLVAQLLDLRTGNVLGVRTALNGQARHGADIMSRIEFAINGGEAALREIIRNEIGAMVRELLVVAGRDPEDLRKVILVGNTVMHHLFCGVSVVPLASFPFESSDDALKVFAAPELGWALPASVSVRFLPCLGSFVGSDILAGILATRLHESDALVALVDLGTNGEMVVGRRGQLVCASTAAGPAFEGARIAMGMRAATGAISRVILANGRLECHVLGHVAPRGLCGSGLVDAVAAGLDAGWIRPNGRLSQGERLPLAEPVGLTQGDIRELQLAKGAIAAGLRLLTQQLGAQVGDITQLHLAGAFGNYISRASAKRIGLLPFGPEKVRPAGNTALLGAKMALFHPGENGAYADLRAQIQHVPLSADPVFEESFVEEMIFPG